MKLNLNTLNAMIIFSYKNNRYQLTEELLKLMHLFEDGQEYKIVKRPSLRLVGGNLGCRDGLKALQIEIIVKDEASVPPVSKEGGQGLSLEMRMD